MMFNTTFNNISTRKNCFRYLKLMSPLNAAICITISYTLWVEWYYLKNNYLTLRSKVKVPRRSLWYVTLPYGHTPTYQISLTYLERQKCYGPDKKILFKKQLFDLEVKGHYSMLHTALWSCTHIPNIIDLSGKKKKLWYGQASLRRSGRKNQTKTICLPSFEEDIIILWRSVLLVEETRIHTENHWQTLSHKVVSSTPRLNGKIEK
jgi:hypothetical protein